MYLRIRVPGQRWHDALSLLRPLAESTRALSGCLSCVLLQDEEASGSLWLIEKWAAEESLLRHVQSDAFRMIFAAMELSVDTPDLRFRRLEELGGLEIVEQARQSQSI